MGYRLKVVERAGTKIENILHQSDPWGGQICEREKCMLCATKKKTGKDMHQDCTKRSSVYQTWCNTCLERDTRNLEENGDNKNVREENRDLKVYKYIGETARSTYERGFEHQQDATSLNTTSHILKHFLDQHEGEKIEDLDFRMQVMRYTRTAFQRQILESVLIQENRDHHILNSRSEYNRCSLPRLSTKMGDKEFKQWEKEIEEESRKDEMLEDRIKEMRKTRNKANGKNRGNRPTKDQPAKKRRRMDIEGNSEESRKLWGKVGNLEDRKRKNSSNELIDLDQTPSKKSRSQKSIRDFFCTEESVAKTEEKKAERGKSLEKINGSPTHIKGGGDISAISNTPEEKKSQKLNLNMGPLPSPRRKCSRVWQIFRGK